MDVTMFTALGNIVENIMTTIQKASINQRFMELQSVVGILIVLSIMYKGYQTLAGKAQDPIRDLVWDIARKLMILTFVMNVSGWLTASISALKGIYEWAGGGSGFYTRLDSITSTFMDVLVGVWNNHNGLDAIIGCFIVFFMIISFVSVMITFVFTVVSASLTNTFLIIALPLALFCFMYENTRQVFVQWCNMFISNIFLLLFMTCFIDFLCNSLMNIYGASKEINQKNASLWIAILQPIFLSGILITCISVIKTLASNLAQVSLDSAGASAMQNFTNSIGGSAGRAVRGAGRFGLGMVSGKTDLAEKRGGLTGLAGFGAKKGLGVVGTGAKMLLSKFRNT